MILLKICLPFRHPLLVDRFGPEVPLRQACQEDLAIQLYLGSHSHLGHPWVLVVQPLQGVRADPEVEYIAVREKWCEWNMATHAPVDREFLTDQTRLAFLSNRERPALPLDLDVLSLRLLPARNHENVYT